jgi:hypothetical protein
LAAASLIDRTVISRSKSSLRVSQAKALISLLAVGCFKNEIETTLEYLDSRYCRRG